MAYFVMELLEGETLAARIARSLAEAYEKAGRTADAARLRAAGPKP